MTEASAFFNWQKAGEPTPQYSSASPNLKQLAKYTGQRWKLKNLGIYNKRPIRNGTVWSSHAFGAAVDLGYSNRADLEHTVLPWLIENSQELGIQRIHDYTGKRYWQAGKGWVKRSPGDGGAWIHVETHPTAWGNHQPIAERLSESPQSPAKPTPAPTPPTYPGRPLRVGLEGDPVKHIQHTLGLTVDGRFGRVTDQAVRTFQDRKSTRLNSSHVSESRMPSSA